MLVVTLDESWVANTTLKLLKEVHRDSATYNYPCANTGPDKKIPTFPKVCPWALFMVIHKAEVTGNCLRENGIGWSKSPWCMSFIFGRAMISQRFGPVITINLNIYDDTLRITNLVPLHSPDPMLRFLRIITG